MHIRKISFLQTYSRYNQFFRVYTTIYNAMVIYTKQSIDIFVAEIMKREADAGTMTGSGGPTSPHKRYRQGDDELRLLIPSKVRFYRFQIPSCETSFQVEPQSMNRSSDLL